MAYFRKKQGNKIKNNNKYSWVEESCFFDTATKRQVASPQTNRYVGNSFSKNAVRRSMLVVCVIFLIVIARIFYLQVILGNRYLTLAEGNRQRIIPIPSERGIIYDKNARPLTKNVPNFSLALIPQDLPREEQEREEVVKKLAELTKRDAADIRMLLEEFGSYSYESIIIQEDLSYEEALMVYIQSGELPGISIHIGSKRLYLDDTSSSTDKIYFEDQDAKYSTFSHILGYLGKLNKDELDLLYKDGYLPSDSIGKIGLEKMYEEELRGKYGKKRIEVNAYGREQLVIAEEPPKPGSHIILSIDSIVQDALSSILSEELKKQKKTRASAVAIDPRNGEIIALVSLPTFDNNDFSGGISAEKYKLYIENEDNPLFNRAISGTYPSGSIIKPFIAAIALQEGIITPVTTIISTGGIEVGPWFFPDWKYGGHGATAVRKSIAWSVNTFYYYIGGGYKDFVGLGIEKIREYLEKFGFAQKTGIDLPSEAQGFVPSKAWKEKALGQQWYIGDTYNLSIGQGYLLVTPLQIAVFTSAIANGGSIYRPHLVEKIIDPVSKETKQIVPEIINEGIVDSTNIRTAALGMRDCVIYGSCSALGVLPVDIAGKTGTAQWHNKKDNHAWFTSFAPFENPEIVVTILIEEGGEGSESALPIAYKFYNWWWRYRNGLVDEYVE